MPELERGDATVSYDVSGDGEPVTLLHGFTLAGRSWMDLVKRMPAGRMWIMPDLRGHGHTRIAPGAPCTMEACGGDLAAMWDHLGIERSHVVGYSMGGRLALHVAVRLPERARSLLTIGAHGGLAPGAREARVQADEALAKRIERDGVAEFVDYWESLPMFEGLARGQALAGELHAIRLANDPQGLAASLRGMGAGAMEPLWDALGKINVPSTFCAGRDDPGFVESARRLASAVPGARVEVVGGSGHAVQFDQPDAMARVLTDHLRRAAPGSTTARSSSTRD